MVTATALYAFYTSSVIAYLYPADMLPGAGGWRLLFCIMLHRGPCCAPSYLAIFPVAFCARASLLFCTAIRAIYLALARLRSGAA